jgi:tRNA(Ile)-lysidine synthetase-like protein
MTDIILNQTFILSPFYKNINKNDINKILEFGNNTILNSKNHSNENIDIKNTDLYLNCEAFLNKHNFNHIVISISMGVDSAVCLYIFYQLIKYNKKYKNIFLEAVHINYMNRESSLIEEKIVYSFCSKLSINLYIRRIDELQREKYQELGLREFYEDITNKIRFTSYKNIVEDNLNACIILGHNKDDTFENLITNIKNNKYYNNIIGMDECNNINNVNIGRPILNIYKKDIIEFAHTNLIPYLIDSTPKYSQRANIRDKIVPVFNSFDNNLINRMLEFAEVYNSLNNHINNSVIQPFIKEQVIITENECIINCNNNHFNNVIWKKIIKNIFYKVNKSISNKSINNIIKSLNNKEVKNFIIKL